ncbi:MAG: nucleoside hydrolase [Planctomycetota bacterium]
MMILTIVIAVTVGQLGCAGIGLTKSRLSGPRRIPVIYDTDIGGDIDDTWALSFLLASPELDLKLVVTDTHNTEGKAKIVAKLLERAGRTDVPVGIGLKLGDNIGRQAPWIKNYDLTKYPGKVHKDGVQAMIDTIMKSPEPITLIAVGPVPNLREALKREPRIAQKARLVVMGGSVEIKYGRKKGRCAEYNVRHKPKAAQAAYGADWDVTMTPLDTADFVILKGENYAKVSEADNPLAKALIENYLIWSKRAGGKKPPPPRSSTLFDTVAVYLAFATELCEMRDIHLRVDNKGFTVPDPKGKLTHVAMKWKDLDAFKKLLADRLANYPK